MQDVSELDSDFVPGQSYKYARQHISGSWMPADGFRQAIWPVLEDISSRQCKWYVYAHIIDGEIAYIGKGSGSRIANFTRTQRWIGAMCRATSFDARVLSWHDTEQDAYMVERALICMLMPAINGKFRDKLADIREKALAQPESASVYIEKLIRADKG